MKIIDIHKNNAMLLFDYWNEIGKGIPYFFETTYDAFINSLFYDKFNGLGILKDNFIKAAIDEDKVVGFIQYGIPKFHYNETGELLKDPNIGVIRNLYFNQVQMNVGNKLMDIALNYFKNNGIDNLYEDKVYLMWIGITEEKKGTGIGTSFIQKIINYCLSKGYRYMHTDTALNNIKAQKFYEKNGFINHGITRSYLRKHLKYL